MTDLHTALTAALATHLDSRNTGEYHDCFETGACAAVILATEAMQAWTERAIRKRAHNAAVMAVQLDEATGARDSEQFIGQYVRDHVMPGDYGDD